MAYNRVVTLNCELNPDIDCGVDATLSIIGGKWKLKIYKVLRNGQPIRYSAINKQLDGISEKTLTAQLREMEEDGIIKRISYPEVPPRVEYHLTALGHSLETIFTALTSWGQAYLEERKSNSNQK